MLKILSISMPHSWLTCNGWYATLPMLCGSSRIKSSKLPQIPVQFHSMSAVLFSFFCGSIYNISHIFPLYLSSVTSFNSSGKSFSILHKMIFAFYRIQLSQLNEYLWNCVAKPGKLSTDLIVVIVCTRKGRVYRMLTLDHIVIRWLH